jgi:methyl-accepting chemotaxis protein
MDKAGNVVAEGSDRFETVSDKLLNNIRGVDALLDGIESFVEKIQTNVGMLNNIADTLDDAVQAQKTVSNEFKTGIPQMSSALKDAVTGITESTQASALAITSIREELDRTKLAVDQTVNSLTTGVDQYTDKVKDLHLLLDEKIGDAISKIGGTISTLEDTMDEFVEALPRK